MSTAGTVRLTKVRIAKDKVGQKFAGVEITRVLVDVEEHYTDGVAGAVRMMQENPSLDRIDLSDELSANLTFYATAGLSSPSEAVAGIRLRNFKLFRQVMATRDYLMMTCEFEMPLAEARRWVIPAFGDDVLYVVEHSQMSLGGS